MLNQPLEDYFHSTRPTRSRENRNFKVSAHSCDDFFEKLEVLFDTNLTNSFNEIRKILNNTKKRVLKDIAFHILERTKYTFRANRFQWYHYILDIVDTKIFETCDREEENRPQKCFFPSVL